MNFSIAENGGQQLLSEPIINLVKNNLYVLTCSAFANPGVSLIIYDTNTKKSLSTSNNTISSSSCNSHGGGCSANISIQLELATSQYDNLTSVTCEATSINPSISLTEVTSKIVVISPTG